MSGRGHGPSTGLKSGTCAGGYEHAHDGEGGTACGERVVPVPHPQPRFVRHRLHVRPDNTLRTREQYRCSCCGDCRGSSSHSPAGHPNGDGDGGVVAPCEPHKALWDETRVAQRKPGGGSRSDGLLHGRPDSKLRPALRRCEGGAERVVDVRCHPRDAARPCPPTPQAQRSREFSFDLC